MAQDEIERKGHLIEVAMPGGADEEVETIVRRAAGDTDPTPTTAFRRTNTLDATATLFKGTKAGLLEIGRGIADTIGGVGHLAAGGAAAAYGHGAKLLLGAAGAGAIGTVAMGAAAVGLGIHAEAGGQAFIEAYPQLAQYTKGLALATGGSALGGLVLMSGADGALRFAERMRVEPAEGDMTAGRMLRTGVAEIGRGIRDTAVALTGGEVEAPAAPGMRHA